MKNKLKISPGYTLIEILVAVTIFIIVIIGPTGFFIASLRGQRRALSAKEIIDNSSYTLEYIGRALRMAKKDRTGGCITSGYNYENSDGASSVRFLNYDGYCQEFFLQGTQLYEKKSTDGSATKFQNPLPVTSNNLEISLFKFQLSGQGQGDNLQPRATILFEIAKKGEPLSKTRIQTTISQRNLDVAY